jgi:hypothetical protein
MPMLVVMHIGMDLLSTKIALLGWKFRMRSNIFMGY